MEEHRGRQRDDRPITKAFGVQELPLSIPRLLSNGRGLDLPDYLTDKEICEIAATSAAHDNFWCCGDMLRWLQKHKRRTDQYSWQNVGKRWEKAGCLEHGTIDNYKSLAKKYSPEQRTQNLTHGYYDAAGTLPPEQRDKMLEQAELEAWNLPKIQEAAREKRESNSA